jgi:hypothetical protein
VFLLPGAERYRRVLLTVVVVILLGLQAAFRFQPVESLTNRVLGPLQGPITKSAGLVYASLLGAPPAPSSDHAPPTTSALVSTERHLGTPVPIPGMAWLEVPVRAMDPQRGSLVLAAGQDFFLARGQVVAFGNSFLGRIAEVREFESDVELWSSADTRTGLSVTADGLEAVAAVCFGRGRGGAAVVGWSQDENQFQEGVALAWRPRPLDPPGLAAAGLAIGKLQHVGEEERGSALWVVDHSIPAAAEGRVFVAAGAVGTQLIAEPGQRRASASRLLSADALLGESWYAFSSSGGFAPTVLTDRGLVCGEVGAWHGSWGWAERRPPRRWEDRAVALDLEAGIILAAEDWQDSESVLPLFTRGGVGLPRGLWLGYRDFPAPYPGVELEALRLNGSPAPEVP